MVHWPPARERRKDGEQGGAARKEQKALVLREGEEKKKIETDVQHTNVVLAPGNPDADTVSYYRN